MLKQQFKKEEMDDFPSLSCIENYFLYALRNSGQSPRLLYCDSFLCFTDILREFVEKNIAFSNFYKIRRLQNTAAENGIIELKYHHGLFSKSGYDKFDYGAVEVLESEFTKKYGRKLMREDHYILLGEKNETEFYYLNDTPRDDGVIEKERLKNLFGGSMVMFSFTEPVSGLSLEKCAERLYKRICREEEGDPQLLFCRMNAITQARDFLGVLKVSRKRVQEFLSLFIDTAFLNNHLHNLNKAFGALEYMRIKNNADPDAIWRMMNDIYHQDKTVVRKIKHSMQAAIA